MNGFFSFQTEKGSFGKGYEFNLEITNESNLGAPN